MRRFIYVDDQLPQQQMTRIFAIDGHDEPAGIDLAQALRRAGVRSPLYSGERRIDNTEAVSLERALYLSPVRQAPMSRGLPRLWLIVESGPDAGRTTPLGRSAVTIGRGAGNLDLLDPQLSRQHARIESDARGVRLIEAGQEPRDLHAGDRFTLGSSTLALVEASADTSTRDGQESSWPPPRLDPGSPPRHQRAWLLLIGAIAPVALGCALAFITGYWFFLAFSALGLLTGGLQSIDHLREQRRFTRTLHRLTREHAARLATYCPSLGQAALDALHAGPPTAASPHPARERANSGLLEPLRLGTARIVAPIELPQAGRAPRLPQCQGPAVISLRPGLSARATGAASWAILTRLLALAANGNIALSIDTDLAVPLEVATVPGVIPLADLTAPGASTTLLAVRVTGSQARPSSDFLGAQISVDLAGSAAPAWDIMTAPGSDETYPDTPSGLELDGANESTLRRVAQALALAASHRPHRQTVPDVVPLVRPANLWTETAERQLRCQVGQSANGRLELDFVTDGPHLLIAGTTGAGKSELLKTILTGLTDSYSPQEVGLFLVDFKGGATLGPFAGGPHEQAFMTDLSHESAQRMLSCLKYEVRRRERLLAETGAGDYTEFRERSAAAGNSASAFMPRLIVAIDEFRVLADELPDALADLMRIASVGRSLGIHLLLATQRPQGVVTQEMRANINTVLCLRVQSSFDAQDLVGSEAPAHLPPDRPGRGFIRRAGGSPLIFQAASTSTRNKPWQLTELTPSCDAQSIEVAPSSPSPEERLTYPATETTPRRLFSPALPEELEYLGRSHVKTLLPGAKPGLTHVALGLLDDVATQRQVPLVWSASGMPRLALVGGPLANYQQTVCRLADEICRLQKEHHLYIADGVGWLTEITASSSALPRLAGWATPEDPERVLTLLDVIEASSGGAPRVLLVTGLSSWAGALTPPQFARLDERLALLARTAESRGIALIIAGDRDLFSSRFMAVAEHRLYNRTGLGSESTMSWPKLAPTRPLPLRCIYTGPGTDSLGMTTQLLNSGSALKGRHDYPAAALPVGRCVPLPTHAVPASTTPDGVGLDLGVVAPDNRPWSWEPGHVNLILGRKGSGKSTLLQHLGARLSGLVLWAGDGSVIARSTLDRSDTTPSAAAHSDVQRPDTLLVDDADQLSPEWRARIEAWSAAGTTVILTARPAARLFTDLPLAAAARQSETGILLGARSPSDGEFWGWRVTPATPAPPGRALTMIDGELTWTQVWAPEGVENGAG